MPRSAETTSGTRPASKAKSPLEATQELGVDFWNDSCGQQELGEAVARGAVGATSNPVIVGAALEAEKAAWLPVLKDIISKNPRDGEEEIAWALIERMAAKAAMLLHPVHERTGGAKGFLSVQVNPKLYRDPEKMREHGLRLSRLAKNIAIKVPATEAGLEAVEGLTAAGVPVNATVSFSVSQAVSFAQAMARGSARAERAPQSYVTIMVGRLDDHLKRVMDKEKVSIDPGFLNWAGIAVFKKAHALFREKKLRAKLLVAAYRHHLHWSELVGEGIVQSIPYAWWKQFDASGLAVAKTLETPVEKKIVDPLYQRFPDFRRAYDEDGLRPAEFARYGASVHTLDQFITGYHKVLDVIRQQIFSA